MNVDRSGMIAGKEFGLFLGGVCKLGHETEMPCRTLISFHLRPNFLIALPNVFVTQLTSFARSFLIIYCWRFLFQFLPTSTKHNIKKKITDKIKSTNCGEKERKSLENWIRSRNPIEVELKSIDCPFRTPQHIQNFKFRGAAKRKIQKHLILILFVNFFLLLSFLRIHVGSPVWKPRDMINLNDGASARKDDK